MESIHKQHTPNGAFSFKTRTTSSAHTSQAAHAQRNTLIQNNVESNHKQRTPFTSSTQKPNGALSFKIMWNRTRNNASPSQTAHNQRSTLIQNNVESNHNQRTPFTSSTRPMKHSHSNFVDSNHNQRSLFASSTRPTEHSHSKQCGVEPITMQTFHNQHMPIGTFSFKNCGGEPQGTHTFLASCTGTKSNSSYLVKRQKQNLVRKQTTRNCLLARNKTTKQSTTRVCLRRLAVERKLASEEKKGQKQRTPAWK